MGKALKVGQRVRCIKDFGTRVVVGDEGEVVKIGGLPPIGVKWERRISGGHDCYGKCEDGFGYYVNDENLEVIEEGLKIGDRVEVVEGSRYTSMKVGCRGVIMVISNGYPNVGIKFDNKFNNGHDLDGLCEDGYGYWVNEDRLAKIEDGKVEDEVMVVEIEREKFEVGDRVECVENFEAVKVGFKGTIVEIEDDISCLGIKFDKKFEDGHTLLGQCENGYGYWVAKRVVKKIEEVEEEKVKVVDFKVGDRVECIKQYYDIKEGDKGIIVTVENRRYLGLGVRWDKEFERGHTCDDRCEIKHGYYVDNENVKLITEEDVEVEEVALTITKEHLKGLIVGEEYRKMGIKTTICVLTLKSGFEVVGTSACQNPYDFDFELGKKYAYDVAFEKLWEYEAYKQQSLIKEVK